MRRPTSLQTPLPGWTAPLAYLGLALLLCYPALRAPRSLALGSPLVDTWNHVWGFWQVRQAIGELESPLWTALARWPEGGSLWFIDLFGALWTLPVQWLLGPVAAYNLAIVGELALAGWAAFLLARHVTGSAAGAAFAGAVYGATPHLLGQIENGISETISAGWLPLCWLAALRFRDAPTPRRGLLAGASLAICALANFYYGLFAFLGVLALVADALLRRGRRRARVRRRLHWPILAGGALGVPLLAGFAGTLRADDALVLRDPEFVGRTLWGHNMVDLWAFFHPGDYHSPDLKALFDEDLVVVVYIGWLLLLVSGWGILRIRAARPWGAGALLSFVLALGAYLYVGGRYLELPGGGWLPLPFLFLFETIPLFSPISHAFRFAVPLQLCLAMAAAYAIPALAARVRVQPAPLAAGLTALALVEVLFASPARWPLPVARAEIPAVYAQIEGPGAVLDLPISLQVLDRSRYNLYQVGHGRPIPYGLNDPTPTYLGQNPLVDRILALERTSVDTAPPELPALHLALARERLRADGLAAIVVHRRAYPPEVYRRVSALLGAAVGEGEVIGDQLLFRLDAVTTATR